MKIGYVRISKQEQNEAQVGLTQIDLLIRKLLPSPVVPFLASQLQNLHQFAISHISPSLHAQIA